MRLKEEEREPCKDEEMEKIFIITVLLLTSSVLIISGINTCVYKKPDLESKRPVICAGKNRVCARWSLFNSETQEGYYKDCCQGWNKGLFGYCSRRTCIVISQKTFPLQCPAFRGTNLLDQRLFYQLSTPLRVPLKYPEQTKNFLKSVSFPLLNQQNTSVLLRTALRVDLHESDWLLHFMAMNMRNRMLKGKILGKEPKPFTTYAEYANLLKKFREAQKQPIFKFSVPGLKDLLSFDVLQMAPYLKYPSQEMPFHDITSNKRWQQDDVFTMQRLAGLNTMSLKKMTIKDFEADYVNKNYDWNAAVKRATQENGGSFIKMIHTSRVFWIEYKLLHNIPTQHDASKHDETVHRELRNFSSPFCAFVIAKENNEKKLKPVACQMDFSSDADVYSPVDGSKWLLAKMEVQQTDFTYEVFVEHLTKTHVLMEPICVVWRSTMSVYHPLGQIFQWHCRGVLTVNSLALPNLLSTEFAVGFTGVMEIVRRAYKDVSWDVTDFEKNLQKRGVDKKDELPYFPYRDDGLLVWREVEKFATEYVYLYYQNDLDVRKDRELQNFANKLTAEGTGSKNGKGMLKKFPSRIETISELIDVVKRIVFIAAQHSTVNYPTSYYGGFVPNMSTKLYDDPRVPPKEFGFHTLPQVHVATSQVGNTLSLGSLRYDVFLDYADKLKDNRAKAVVKKYHSKLIGDVNKEITDRNTARLKAGKFVYPYFLPKWITNSIQT
ncbi:polyunsaturated fatty acid 5-lipoxygenase-like isoform X2 [Xenia sp. Carnegie-2017]|uniref:polyunsaturated fatty acid 5-lipoxygenase-like isoform X2 n=1 Tax=Xenia sp. Carnegie-2017 TaxID=2897299 RepID=UPI001F03C18A|nr:polyunsaturated fatty acid 5-lipoxygenase-like isoform X2 [Xenia sp. Carnegie-2017]